MAKKENADAATVASEETSDVVTISAEEYERLKAAAAPPNPAPAIEEGPHLADPEIRAAKRAQLREAGVDADDERLTDDMRALLGEED